ncbi:MAG TPA: hypothetical protein VMU16_06110 [Candidatus Binataceae bacterium]|nr:hypothetical protein [Candidatus Binataceae bacterium]
MKRGKLFAIIAILLLATTAPAMAQYPAPHGGYSSIPYFANLPESKDFRMFAEQHPDMLQQLQSKPGEIFNPNWRSQHPYLEQYFQNHPQTWYAIRNQAPNYWDPNFRNFMNGQKKAGAELLANPDLIYNRAWISSHPRVAEYLKTHPQVLRTIEVKAGRPEYPIPPSAPHGWGDYDDHHEWHDYGWWQEHHPNWARKHHPEWYANKEAIEEHHHEMQQEHHHDHGHDNDHHDHHGDHGHDHH